MMTRYWLVAACTIGMSALTGAALAQTAFPSRPVRVLTAGAPGGGSDLTTRAIANWLSLAWGQQVIVDNRPGAAGLTAFDNFVKANPDGHTLLSLSASTVISAQSSADWPHDLLSMIAPISQASSLFYIAFNHPSLPVSTFKELLDRGRANPNKLFFGTGGNAGLQHLGWEIIMQAGDVKFKHVAYKSAQAAVTATISGETNFGFGTLLSLRAHMASGRARPLAVTSRQRQPTLPDLPTLAEQGLPGVQIDQWYGVATSAKVSPAVMNRLSASVIEAIKSPEVEKRLTADGSIPVGSTPEQFSEHIRSEHAKFRKVLQRMGLLVRGPKP
jgi:tripartite-type tricarboxylate transporter receptor subunit TctC